MPYGTSGAIMPLYSPAGVLACPGPGGSPGRLGGVPPAALASSTALFHAGSVVLSYFSLAAGEPARTVSQKSVTYFSAASESIASFEVHDCAGVPPQSLSISPIGTCRFCCKCRPKKYSTAENPFAEAGEHTCHVPTTSSAG